MTGAKQLNPAAAKADPPSTTAEAEYTTSKYFGLKKIKKTGSHPISGDTISAHTKTATAGAATLQPQQASKPYSASTARSEVESHQLSPQHKPSAAIRQSQSEKGQSTSAASL
ncbi:hypothetical protein Nepgr_030064 [Nepenthes gracilis]|uniref:Uncharacterized protein n=1 Tax=Nepenthes gracilis TaxID=150966 RepID=A0AAD3TG29_NEPGR|nr:hypothetical protein Nepgr_030064 [Nepenthes gracilis]